MRDIVKADDFLDDNFLSNDLRVPVTLLQTNACSPLATNAIAGNIWDNFSSHRYKDLPSVGTITVHTTRSPARRSRTQMPAGGRGYTRVAVADQRVVDRAVPAQQQRRPLQPEPLGRRAHGVVRELDRPRCCGRRSARRTRCWATRCRA